MFTLEKNYATFYAMLHDRMFPSTCSSSTLTSGINDSWGINVPPGHDGWKKLATCIESATPMTKPRNFFTVEYVVRLMDPLGNFPQN